MNLTSKAGPSKKGTFETGTLSAFSGSGMYLQEGKEIGMA